MILTIIAVIYLIIGIIIVECTKNISEEYRILVEENTLLYIGDVICWLPDLIKFMCKEE